MPLTAILVSAVCSAARLRLRSSRRGSTCAAALLSAGLVAAIFSPLRSSLTSLLTLSFLFPPRFHLLTSHRGRCSRLPVPPPVLRSNQLDLSFTTLVSSLRTLAPPFFLVSSGSSPVNSAGSFFKSHYTEHHPLDPIAMFFPNFLQQDSGCRSATSDFPYLTCNDTIFLPNFLQQNSTYQSATSDLPYLTCCNDNSVMLVTLRFGLWWPGWSPCWDLGVWLGAPVRFPARDGSLLPPVHTVSFAVQVVRRGRWWLPGGFCLYETGGSEIKKHRQEQNKC